MLEPSHLNPRKQKGFVMKRIDALIRPHQLDDVKSRPAYPEETAFTAEA